MYSFLSTRLSIPKFTKPQALSAQTLQQVLVERTEHFAAARDSTRRPLHVLHVITRLAPSEGGPPEMMRNLAASYQAIGDTLEVATLDDPTAPYLANCAFLVHALGPGHSPYGLSRSLLRWLRANAARFDLIVINNVWLFPAVAAWLAAKGAGVPYAVFTHGALDVFFKRRYPLKHFKKLLYWPLQYRILKNASAVLFTSELERELALASFKPNGWTSVVVPYGTNRPDGDPQTQIDAFYELVPQVRGRQLLLFLGRIHEKKGCDMLIQAFAQVATEHPDVDLVIAGPDQVGLQAKLKKQAMTAGVADRVFWPGMLNGAAKYGAFRAASAFVLPSHQENFGIAVAEALACGTPVLISDQVNIWRQIQDSGVGLVEPDTPEGTLRLLRRWLTMPEWKRASMAAASEGVFQQSFSLRRSAEFIHTLAEVLQARVPAA